MRATGGSEPMIIPLGKWDLEITLTRVRPPHRIVSEADRLQSILAALGPTKDEPLSREMEISLYAVILILQEDERFVSTDDGKWTLRDYQPVTTP
jgi:hypothetical protein